MANLIVIKIRNSMVVFFTERVFLHISTHFSHTLVQLKDAPFGTATSHDTGLHRRHKECTTTPRYRSLSPLSFYLPVSTSLLIIIAVCIRSGSFIIFKCTTNEKSNLATHFCQQPKERLYLSREKYVSRTKTILYIKYHHINLEWFSTKFFI